MFSVNIAYAIIEEEYVLPNARHCKVICQSQPKNGSEKEGTASLCKASACTRIVEAEQLQDDEPSKSTFFNSSSQLLRNVLICLCLIGQFRIELNRAELVHGFLSLSKVDLPLMEAKIIESIMLKMFQISYLWHF